MFSPITMVLHAQLGYPTDAYLATLVIWLHQRYESEVSDKPVSWFEVNVVKIIKKFPTLYHTTFILLFIYCNAQWIHVIYLLVFFFRIASSEQYHYWPGVSLVVCGEGAAVLHQSKTDETRTVWTYLDMCYIISRYFAKCKTLLSNTG